MPCRLNPHLPPRDAPTAPAGPNRGNHRLGVQKLAFNERAGSYTRLAVVQRQLAAWLAEWLEPSARVAALSAAEVGAGDGLFTQLLAPRFRQLTAIDIAPRMVEQGRRRLPRVAWRVGDAWQLDGEPVDRLYSASLLHWCDEPSAVLRRWRRLTKPDGRMLHGFYVAPTLAEWHSISPARSPVDWRSPTQWETYFRRAGWTIVRSQAQIRVQRFVSAFELFRFFHHTGAVTSRHTPVARLRQMIADYDRRFRSRDGTPAVNSTWTFFRIEAVNDGLTRSKTMSVRRRA